MQRVSQEQCEWDAICDCIDWGLNHFSLGCQQRKEGAECILLIVLYVRTHSGNTGCAKVEFKLSL